MFIQEDVIHVCIISVLQTYNIENLSYEKHDLFLALTNVSDLNYNCIKKFKDKNIQDVIFFFFTSI